MPTDSSPAPVCRRLPRPVPFWRQGLLRLLLLGLALPGLMGTGQAAELYLQTGAYTKTLPAPAGGTIDVPMWGFATCDANFTGCSPVTAGLRLDALSGESLTIHLSNTLPTPVSLSIPGQAQSFGGDPTFVADGQMRQRVRSFTHETANGAKGSYTWSNLRPGTFLLQSATEPSIQVPMGLYGALVVSPGTPAAGCGTSAYGSTASCYETESLLLYSEIDPTLNAAIAAAAGNPANYPHTVDYSPTYLLINGEVTPTINSSGGTVLLRYLNAGLRSHTASIVGLEMSLLAEDGNLYPGSIKRQSTLLLPAGKTKDVILQTPLDDSNLPVDITLALVTGMQGFSNAAFPNGAGIAGVVVGDGSPPSPPPSIYTVNDEFATPEETPISDNVLTNDVGLTGATVSLVIRPTDGDLSVNVDGSFTYTPNANFSGSDGFTYKATLGGQTYTGQATINVSFVNDAPMAVADAYANVIGTDINIAAPGVLGNDSDPDGDTLTAVQDGSVAGLILNADGSFSYSGASTSFSYHAMDGDAISNTVTVTLTVNEPSNFSLTVQEPGGAPVDSYRWLVEEDTMWHPDPAVIPDDYLAINFHKSHMPVLAQGCLGSEDQCGLGKVASIADLVLDPSKHYYLTVLPTDAGSGSGHTVGGAPISPGVTEATVTVQRQPLPYAQLSVQVFEDINPTNGAMDGVEEALGLGGFQITLEDAGGRYGIAGGTLMQDADGNMLKNSLDCFGEGNMPPMGVILSCPDTPANRAAGVVGHALVQHLYPAKYGVIVTPPGGDRHWIQTSTIEGTKVIDAWLKAGEPPYFREFGPSSAHVIVGFLDPASLTLPAGGNSSITGQVTNLHMSRPPEQTLWDSGSYTALSHTRAWVGLNSSGGTGPNLMAVQADENGNFAFSGVPDGSYQLVIWDSFLDQLMAYRGVTVSGGDVDVGHVPVFQWFGRLEHYVFLDENENGIRDSDEAPLREQTINIRWRDGTVNQSFPTDNDGFVPFDEVFPFFSWQVAEVDFLRYKPTGLTVTVDGGGDVSSGAYKGVLNPQIQSEEDGGGTTRTEIGPVLTQGFQSFLGQTSIFEWGKAPYQPGQNGGIAGIVYYASTRAENDPRLAAGDPWEPGIPAVTLRLYREIEKAGGGTTLTLVKETQTDSWDASLPSGCPGADLSDAAFLGDGNLTKCYDGLRNFNQVRPGVFDGGYAFNDIPPGRYVVEVIPPQGYELVKEEDVNVGFGDTFANVPVPLLLPGGAALFFLMPDPALVTEAMAPEPGIAQPPCVGTMREVPPYLSLFPSEMAEAPFASVVRPLCDRKAVILADQSQAAADFFLFTSAPVAGRATGMILDDLAQEFDRNSPQFGEKWAPPFVPVSIRDFTGHEISRVYSDQLGRYNIMVPSTFSANLPSPSGYAPSMLTTCMNDPGPVPGPNGLVIDPHYNPAYSNFCYTLQYMPGTTTYLDTPVLPVSAFASGYNPPDCAQPDTSPVIASVDWGGNGGPWHASSGAGQSPIVIRSVGDMEVPNPAYEGPGTATTKTVTRDYGFGSTQGQVTVNGRVLNILTWSDTEITARFRNNAQVTSGELLVTRGNGMTTATGIYLTVGGSTPLRVPQDYATIQDAIDAASPGALILVDSGAYQEHLIMWKPVRLQGAGAGSTFINAVEEPSQVLVAWRTQMDCLFGIGDGCQQRVDGLPGQTAGAAGYINEEGAAITLVGVFDSGSGQPPTNSFRRGSAAARIDGFGITGASTGGGILLNANAHRVQISNNHLFGNDGLLAGGIRIGRPFLELEAGPFDFNTGVTIHHNTVVQNGGLGGAGGGISIATGSTDYQVTSNFICGNFTTGDGGGIGHLGLSNNGLISNNQILFNQSFDQSLTVSGGGIFIGGEAPVGNGLSQGAGNVQVQANRIQGNHAGAGHGGGIRTQFVNGEDIPSSIGNNGRANLSQWYQISILDNSIINNVAGWSGGGVSLQDTARSEIRRNVIANNDATATVSAVFTTPDPNVSANQPAGVSSEPHSPALTAAIPSQNNTNALRLFSNPTMTQNIIWHNRSFHYEVVTGGVAGLVPLLSQGVVGECVNGANYWDLGVLGGGFSLTNGNPQPPNFTPDYCNGGRKLTPPPGPILALPALDEGGAAWIDVRYGPLTQTFGGL